MGPLSRKRERGLKRMPPRFRRIVPVGLAIGLLAGCAVGPDFHPPDAAAPGQFVHASGPANVDPATWWHALQDKELDTLVDRALTANPSLQIALARLQQARTFETALTGYALPRVEGDAGGGRGTGSDMTRGRVAGPLDSGDHAIAPAGRITQIAGADAVWDIDLFGRFRREIEAARYDAQAAAAARDAVQIAVIADVVRAYVDLRGLQLQLAVYRQNLRASQDLLALVQARFDRGMTNELDLTLARREYAGVQAAVAPLAAQVDAASYAIATLLGQFPGDLQQELAVPGMIPAVPARIAAGQPLELIRRRPDIREAEWELAAATARIGVATANLFPQLSLGAGLGVQGQGLGYVPASSQRIWTAGYAAVLPLLDFGALDALANIADLQAREQLYNYRRTVQVAVQEVDTAIAVFLAQQDRLASLGEAVSASQRATELATQRYDRGLTDFLNVVDAQRQEYELQDQYVVAQMNLAEQFVVLYRSLGGGWEQFSGPPQLPMPQPAIVAMFRRLLQPGTVQ
jgi:NodT family efflux transporter outer membrane factor (OMF) lipoprotein